VKIKDILTRSEGRISRSQYWIGLLCCIGLGLIGNIILAMLGLSGNSEILEGIVGLAVLALSFMVCIKRFHDLNKTGWFSLLMIVPFVNLIVGLFWLGFVKGTDGHNAYGEDPLLAKILY
jgi:uncharacterized membrane protein YhaH (DUF805 family)